MNGGDPTRLSLRGFIDVAFAVLVGEYQRLGVDLLAAIERVSALGTEPDEAPAPVPAPERIDNKQSIQELMGMMSGVKGAPVR